MWPAGRVCCMPVWPDGSWATAVSHGVCHGLSAQKLLVWRRSSALDAFASTVRFCNACRTSPHEVLYCAPVPASAAQRAGQQAPAISMSRLVVCRFEKASHAAAKLRLAQHESESSPGPDFSDLEELFPLVAAGQVLPLSGHSLYRGRSARSGLMHLSHAWRVYCLETSSNKLRLPDLLAQCGTVRHTGMLNLDNSCQLCQHWALLRRHAQTLTLMPASWRLCAGSGWPSVQLWDVPSCPACGLSSPGLSRSVRPILLGQCSSPLHEGWLCWSACDPCRAAWPANG